MRTAAWPCVISGMTLRNPVPARTRRNIRTCGPAAALGPRLMAEDLDLVGKPDYLIQSKQGLIPVEVKTGRTPARPFESHVFQVAAYCALVERNFKQRPPYGIIRYPERR